MYINSKYTKEFDNLFKLCFKKKNPQASISRKN